MGIQTQLCGFFLLIIILFLWFLQPRINLRTQRIFVRFLITGIVCLFLDGLSVLLIVQAGGDYGLPVRFICKAYIVSLYLLTYTSFCYLTLELEHHAAGIKYVKQFCLAASFAVVLLICILPIRVHGEAGHVYTYGPSVYVLYGCGSLMILGSFVLLTLCRKHMDSRRWKAGMVWIILWIAASVIQMLDAELLLVGFVSALGIMIVFIKLENPEAYLDRRTGALNEQALRMFIDENYENGREFYLLSIALVKIRNQADVLSMSEADELLQKSAAYLRELGGEERFKHAGWEYTILFYDEESMHRTAQEIESRFKDEWVVKEKRILVDILVVEMSDCSIARDPDDMLEINRSFVEHCKKHAFTGIQSLDKEWVKQIIGDTGTVALIREAIEKDRVEVFYQPIYSTAEARYVSAEALMRIRREDGSIVPPLDFIPVAEKNGIITQLDEIVFRKVCQFAVQEKLEEKGIRFLEINLSAAQSCRPGLAEEYIGIMSDSGVDPALIRLEITESAAIASKDILLENMRKLSEYGVKFSLDDFGTGYSNLNYIMELPVQIVKFDKQMTGSYFENKKGRLVMQAAVDMIGAVGMEIVSEGVETKEQLEELEQIGIEYIQGYYFSKPLSEREFLLKLEEPIAR